MVLVLSHLTMAQVDGQRVIESEKEKEKEKEAERERERERWNKGD